MIARARRKCRSLPNVRLLELGAQELSSLRGKGFDRIVSCNVLYALPSPREALRESCGPARRGRAHGPRDAAQRLPPGRSRGGPLPTGAALARVPPPVAPPPAARGRPRAAQPPAAARQPLERRFWERSEIEALFDLPDLRVQRLGTTYATRTGWWRAGRRSAVPAEASALAASLPTRRRSVFVTGPAAASAAPSRSSARGAAPSSALATGARSPMRKQSGRATPTTSGSTRSTCATTTPRTRPSSPSWRRRARSTCSSTTPASGSPAVPDEGLACRPRRDRLRERARHDLLHARRLRSMVAARSGTIINVSSLAAVQPMVGMTATRRARARWRPWPRRWEWSTRRAHRLVQRSLRTRRDGHDPRPDPKLRAAGAVSHVLTPRRSRRPWRISSSGSPSRRAARSSICDGSVVSCAGTVLRVGARRMTVPHAEGVPSAAGRADAGLRLDLIPAAELRGSAEVMGHLRSIVGESYEDPWPVLRREVDHCTHLYLGRAGACRRASSSWRGSTSTCPVRPGPRPSTWGSRPRARTQGQRPHPQGLCAGAPRRARVGAGRR